VVIAVTFFNNLYGSLFAISNKYGVEREIKWYWPFQKINSHRKASRKNII